MIFRPHKSQLGRDFSFMSTTTMLRSTQKNVYLRTQLTVGFSSPPAAQTLLAVTS